MSFLSIVFPSTIWAKWTLIPRYTSYINISAQSDTIDNKNTATTIYLNDSLGMFRAAIIHENLSQKRLKYIKRQQTMAGIYALSAVLSSTSAFSSNYRQRFYGRINTYINSTLSNIYEENAKAAKTLEMTAWIENTSDEEIMIADQERGRIWFLLPSQYISFKLSNPDVMQLRISTITNSRVHYATIAGGSVMKETWVSYEDDEIWIFPLRDKDKDDENYDVIIGYCLVDKLTGEQKIISKEEYKKYKK